MGVADPFPEHFFEAARKAADVFEQLGAEWMFIGAVPVAAWGRIRATTDADFAISLDFSGAADLDREMLGAGFEKTSGPVEIPAKRLVLSKYWAPYPGGGLGIDVFLTTGYDTGLFLKGALARKVEITFHGGSYWMTGPEDLVVFKILAFRSKDLDDVATILERRFDTLDWAYLHARARDLKLEGLLGQVVGEFMKATGREGSFPWPQG